MNQCQHRHDRAQTLIHLRFDVVSLKSINATVTDVVLRDTDKPTKWQLFQKCLPPSKEKLPLRPLFRRGYAYRQANREEPMQVPGRFLYVL